jgi:ParB-like chromosome segregation protein Spo0J
MSNDLPYHPFADIFPLMEGEEFDALVADIGANGQCESTTVYQNKILDGRNRYRACRLLGIEPRLTPFVGDDKAARAFVFGKNLHRRHLTA